MKPNINWHTLAFRGVTICKCLLLLFIFSLFIHLCIQYIPYPYNGYASGMLISIFLIIVFRTIRMRTFKPGKLYDTTHLLTKSPQLTELLLKLHRDIGRFEEGAAYFFNGVKAYKYATLFLSGISTILLGLSVKDLPLPVEIRDAYPGIAKNIAFVIGTIVTLYTAITTYWNTEKYWLQNKTVANKLVSLKDDIENLDKAGLLTPDMIQQKFNAYQLIKSEFYKYWQGALSGQSGTAN